MIYGYELSIGAIVCVDCDVHPPGSKVIEDPRDVECDSCGTRLSDVEPVGGAA